MTVSLVPFQAGPVSLQRTYDVQAVASSPKQAMLGAEKNEIRAEVDEFAFAFDAWYSTYKYDPFTLELPLSDIFFHQLLTLVHDFESEHAKDKSVHYYYVEVSKEFYKWRQGESLAKETLIKILSNFANRMPKLNEESELKRHEVMAGKEKVITLWINILKSSSYEKLLLTPKEMKRLYIGKEEDTLEHPLLKKSNFTRIDYSNYLKLNAYNQVTWSCGCLSRYFSEFREDAGFFEKIMYALKELSPYGENTEWNRYMYNRIVRELDFNPTQTSVINDSLRKKIQTFLLEYSKVVDFLTSEVLETQSGFSVSFEEKFAILYINDHKTLAQTNSNGIKNHTDGIKKYCKGLNGTEGIIGTFKKTLELYNSVYFFFLFLESIEIEEFVQRVSNRNFEHEFEACLNAFIVKQNDPVSKMDAMREEIRILKKYQDLDRYPDFFRVRKDVFIPFLRCTKDMILSTQAVLETSLSRFEKLGTKIEVQRVEKERRRPKESLGNLPMPQARVPSPILEEKKEAAIAAPSRVRTPKIQDPTPPVVLSAQQILRSIETKLFAKMDQVKDALHIFAKERIGNAKLHLMNVNIHLNEIAGSHLITKRELFQSVTGLAFGVNLCVEQLLMALVLHMKNVKDLDSISQYRTHDLKNLLINCDGVLEKKWSGFISDINGMGVFLIDLGSVSSSGLASFRAMLFNLYQDLRSGEKEIDKDVVSSCKKIAEDLYKFCDEVVAALHPSNQNHSIDSDINEWKKHESVIEISRMPSRSSYPYEYLFHDVKGLLKAFQTSVHPSYLDNIVTNSLTRLEQAILLLQEKRPRRAFLDFSTIFFLNQVIAEQVLGVCHLIQRGGINHALYDHDLEKMADDLKDFSFTAAERNFLQKGKDVRLAARYPMSLSLDKGALNTLLEQVLLISEAFPDMDTILEGSYVVTARNKKLEFDPIELQIMNDCVLLESVLRKVLEGCHP